MVVLSLPLRYCAQLPDRADSRHQTQAHWSAARAPLDPTKVAAFDADTPAPIGPSSDSAGCADALKPTNAFNYPNSKSLMSFLLAINSPVGMNAFFACTCVDRVTFVD